MSRQWCAGELERVISPLADPDQSWKSGALAPRAGVQKDWVLAPVVANSETSDDFISLARVAKTQGRRGEVAAEIHTDAPGRFAAGMKLFALPAHNEQQGRERIANKGRTSDPERFETEGAKQFGRKKVGRFVGNEERRELEIEDLWPHKSLLVLKFRGIDSISDAQALVGAELQVPRAERAKLEPGWNYVSDLVGCAVFDVSSGVSRDIGTIEDVQFGAGEAPLLVVSGEGGKKFDVPFAEAYLRGVDLERRRVHMNLPEGMLDINTPMTQEEKRQQSSPKRTRR